MCILLLFKPPGHWSKLFERNNLCVVSFPNAYCYVSIRTLIPVLHQKAKRGTPHQAKQAVHCIHAIFNNKEVQLAQIFEVGDLKCTDIPEFT